MLSVSALIAVVGGRVDLIGNARVAVIAVNCCHKKDFKKEIYVYIYIYVYTYIHIRVCIYIYMCVYIYVYYSVLFLPQCQGVGHRAREKTYICIYIYLYQ